MSQKNTAPRKREVKTDKEIVIFQQTEEIEKIRRTLEKEKEEFDRKKRKFEREQKDFQRRREAEKREFQRQQESENRRIAQENQLFRMKWRLLEEEVQKLADEKRRMENRRNFYERVNDFEQKSNEKADFSLKVVRGEMFFAGVTSELALKKRYKDLIKIYHPDNVSGDTNTVQEINREYDQLKNRLESC